MAKWLPRTTGRSLFASLGFALLIGLTSAALASIDVYEFDDPQQEALFHELVNELRCPKCQNNSLADSNAGLAKDLKDLVYDKVRGGATHDEVVDYLVERYGPFISYQPPEDASLIILAPALLFVLIGAGWAWHWTRSQQREQLKEQDDA